MKLLRLKITDPEGFRSLQAGFEHHFRTPWELQDEQSFGPFICAGPNGSGKSNLLEVLAAIFFQLEVQRMRRSFLPENFLYDEEKNPEGFRDGDGIPDGFELEYLIRIPAEYRNPESPPFAQVRVVKEPSLSPKISWRNQTEFKTDNPGVISERERDFLLPQYILGYSSGENEILSLPFFKMRFVEFDEYWNSLKNQLPYPGRPETRLAYLDNGFSQAILLCNLLFEDGDTLKPFREDVGVDELKEFRIIIKRSIEVSAEIANEFMGQSFGEGGFGQDILGGLDNPALSTDEDSGRHTINLMKLLQKGPDSAANFDPIVTRLKRCATCSFVDEDTDTDTLYLDYYVNEATREAFKENFSQSPVELF